jgi:alginate O-acetyltransferase complex protein AlgI
MLFNSIDFALFLPIVFIFYWLLCKKSFRLQNILILFASYIFYGWWSWKFLILIFFSTTVDFLIAKIIAKEKNSVKKKMFLTISIIANLGLLFTFKYYNFFTQSFVSAFSLFGYSIKANSLNIILPVGISFYTFQTMSYTIDIFRGKIKPSNNFIAFSAFVSFFPQLVAGPIERATNLLPQFTNSRKFSYSKSVDGLRQILWGLFKKIVIADNCAIYVNEIFSNYDIYPSSTLIIGAVLFAFQIYGDFSGYSDIAIGSARLLGFNLMQNFAFPYFSRDIAEFWRRWHISLSTWFRDYVYIPLGGSRGNIATKIRNILIIFTLSGFWHGANWTFILWGVLNAIFFLPLLLTKRNRKNIEVVAKHNFLPSFKEFFQILTTFFMTTLAWIFFRSENLTSSINYLIGILDSSLFSMPFILESQSGLKIFPKFIFLLVLLQLIVEWFGRENNHPLETLSTKAPKAVRFIIYYSLIFFILYYSGNEQQFIYFQF